MEKFDLDYDDFPSGTYVSYDEVEEEIKELEAKIEQLQNTSSNKDYNNTLRQFVIELDEAIEDIGILETYDEIGLWCDVKSIIESFTS